MNGPPDKPVSYTHLDVYKRQAVIRERQTKNVNKIILQGTAVLIKQAHSDQLIVSGGAWANAFKVFM